MNLKKNYICSVCKRAWECFVFNEFAVPFSICVYCYIDFESAVRKSSLTSQTCHLCDTSKECYTVLINKTDPISHMHVCKECFVQFKDLIETKRQR